MQVLPPMAMMPPPPMYSMPGQWAPSGPSPMLSLADHVLQHLRLFFLVWLAVMVLGLLYLLLASPVYRADTLVQIGGKRIAAPPVGATIDASGVIRWAPSEATFSGSCSANLFFCVSWGSCPAFWLARDSRRCSSNWQAWLLRPKAAQSPSNSARLRSCSR